MFAQCVGILASSLTSSRIRLVMGGVGEVTSKFSRLEKTLAILFQQRGQILSVGVEPLLLPPGPLRLHKSLAHKNPCVHNPCKYLKACIFSDH